MTTLRPQATATIAGVTKPVDEATRTRWIVTVPYQEIVP